MLRVKHYKELPVLFQKSMWDCFLAWGTSHSAQAVTLSYIIERCEKEGVPYRLTASPGQGYFIEPYKPKP